MNRKWLYDFRNKYPIIYLQMLNLHNLIKKLYPIINKWKLPGTEVDDFIFIMGSGRSGNTLLRRLLMENCSIYIPPETYVIPRIIRHLSFVKGFDWDSIVNLVISTFEYQKEFDTFELPSLREFAIKAKSWKKERQNLPTLIKYFYKWIADYHGVEAKIVGDKTPLNLMNAPNIIKIFCNSKFIFLKRDGVDVCYSYINAKIYENIEDAAWRWVNSYRIWNYTKEKLLNKQYYEISYERMVSKAENELEKLGKHLDLPVRNKTLDISNKLGDVGKQLHHKNVMNKINANSIGNGRKSLSNMDKKKIGRIMNRYLVEMGYMPV